MTLKLAQFCDNPPKISTKSSYPPKIFIFLKPPKNIEIQNFEPQKIARAYVCVKISEYPAGTSNCKGYFYPSIYFSMLNSKKSMLKYPLPPLIWSPETD